MGRGGYTPDSRRKMLDLLGAGRSVVDVARDLEISKESIYIWCCQDRIDRRLVPGLSSAESSELTAAEKRIADCKPAVIATRCTEVPPDAWTNFVPGTCDVGLASTPGQPGQSLGVIRARHERSPTRRGHVRTPQLRRVQRPTRSHPTSSRTCAHNTGPAAARQSPRYGPGSR